MEEEGKNSDQPMALNSNKISLPREHAADCCFVIFPDIQAPPLFGNFILLDSQPTYICVRSVE